MLFYKRFFPVKTSKRQCRKFEKDEHRSENIKYTLNFPPQRCHISVYFFFPRICIKNGAMSYTLLCGLLLGVNMFAWQFLYSSIFYTKLLSGHSRGHDERNRKFSLSSGAGGVGERPSVGNSPRQRGEGSPSSLPKSCCQYCNRQWFFSTKKKNHSGPHPFQIDPSLKGSTVLYHWSLQGLLSVGMWAKYPYT